MMVAQTNFNNESNKHGSADVQSRIKERDEVYSQIRKTETELRNIKSNNKRILDEQKNFERNIE
jgi:hypothetical protein